MALADLLIPKTGDEHKPKLFKGTKEDMVGIWIQRWKSEKTS